MTTTSKVHADLLRFDKPWRALVTAYRTHSGHLLVAAFYYTLKSSPLWIMPLITANVIDIISRPHPHALRDIGLNAMFLLCALGLNVPFHCAFVRRLSLAARSVEAEFRSALVRKFQELSISYFKNTSSGALQSKVLRDVEAVDQTARMAIEGGLSALTSIVSAVAVTLVRAPQFLVVFLISVPIITALRVFLSGKLKTMNRALRHEIEGMSSHIAGMIEMIPITRAHALEEAEIERATRKLGQVRNAGLQLDSQNALFQSTAWTSFNFFTMATLIVAAWLACTGIIPLSPGDVIMLSAFFATISNAVLNVANMIPNMTRGLESVRSIGEVLESPDIEKNVGKLQLEDVRGEFHFESVTFIHSGASRGSVRDFSLHVRAGETIGVAGPSGAGKSTLMSLILGFDRPTSGRILLDGRDVNEIDFRTFRRFVGVVTQDSLLFHGTLRENVTYGIPNVSAERVRRALEDANAAEFVDGLPKGIDTMLGERGARLSGGQKQRIAIARALIRDPRVLILDEATSALDVASEKLVQAALDRLMQGRTTFIVAHRLSTIRNANRIVLLSDGRIAEIGTPVELENQGGLYAAMCAMQQGV
jgi:ATP-binding cassette subfamily B protein